MGTRGVYVVHFNAPGGLTVTDEGKSVPMADFVKTHVPVQVSSLTHAAPGTKALIYVGPMIADEQPEESDSRSAKGALRRATPYLASEGDGRSRTSLSRFAAACSLGSAGSSRGYAYDRRL